MTAPIRGLQPLHRAKPKTSRSKREVVLSCRLLHLDGLAVQAPAKASQLLCDVRPTAFEHVALIGHLQPPYGTLMRMVTRRAGSGRAKRLRITVAAATAIAVSIVVAVGLWHSTNRTPDSYESSYVRPTPTEAKEPTFALPQDPRVLFLGDSLTDGTAASDKKDLGFAPRLARIEGWSDFVVDGVGLSGFLAPGVSEEAHRNYRDRLQQIFFTNTYSPNVIIFQAGANDRKYSSADIHKKVVETIAVARRYWPDVQLLLVGPITSSTELSAANAAYRSAAYESEIFYIDAMRTPIISANERKEMISDDGWHANDAGHQKIADELHQRISEIRMKIS